MFLEPKVYHIGYYTLSLVIELKSYGFKGILRVVCGW